jgi:predicted nuclease with TOPRIM domain
MKSLQSDSRKLLAESERLVSTLQRSGADFLFLDLDIALSMAKSALSSGTGTQKRARNQKTARRAYDTILHLSHRLKMTKQERDELRKKLAAVKRELEQLGERF